MALPLTRFAYRMLYENGHTDEEGKMFDGTDDKIGEDHEGHAKGDDHEHKGKGKGYMEEGEEKELWTFEEFKGLIQFVFLMFAIANTSRFGMETLRYRTVESYYDAGYLNDKKSRNWWKLGNDIFLMGGFGIWATATFTQLLAVFGIAEGLNFLVWEWGVLGIFGILNFCYAILSSYAYDLAF